MKKLSLIETLCKENLPYGRLPTTEEITKWVECPDNHPELNNYMLARPELTKYIRKILDFINPY